MKKRRVTLFTAHSPAVGGGGAILRSLIANLPDLDITWYYLNQGIVPGYEKGFLGQPLMGGPLLQDVLQTRKMLNGSNVTYINNIVDRLLALDCDGYWIVSHNEGLRIAFELTSRQQVRPVHMTVHDDWEGALCARSVRYRLMGGIARMLTIRALKTVTSFDVISAGMRNYYRLFTARRGDVCHRYLPGNSILINKKIDHTDKVLVGHIGSVYDKKDLFRFVDLLKVFFGKRGQSVSLQMWGCHLIKRDLPPQFRDNLEFFDTLPEENVIPLLGQCDFVYCMYPLNRALHTFSKTSLPTKLSSYIQAVRPVFGHGPSDSTLAEFLSTTKLGSMWTTTDRQAGIIALENIMSLNPINADWQAARRQYFGEKNLEVMTKVLGNAARL